MLHWLKLKILRRGIKIVLSILEDYIEEGRNEIEELLEGLQIGRDEELF